MFAAARLTEVIPPRKTIQRHTRCLGGEPGVQCPHASNAGTLLLKLRATDTITSSISSVLMWLRSASGLSTDESSFVDALPTGALALLTDTSGRAGRVNNPCFTHPLSPRILHEWSLRDPRKRVTS